MRKIFGYWRDLIIPFLSGLAVAADAQDFHGWSIDNFSDFNCSIPKIIRGEWYSRESNEDARNNIDQDTMTARGTCKAYRYTYISIWRSFVLRRF